jgi:hypothetical protein
MLFLFNSLLRKWENPERNCPHVSIDWQVKLLTCASAALTSGRQKPGSIDSDFAPILLRIGVNPDARVETISRIGSIFHVAAGLVSNLRAFADRIGRKWLTGVSSARSALASSPAQIN